MRPSSGARYVLEKVEESPTGLVYRGHAHLPEHDVPVEVRVDLPGLAAHGSAGTEHEKAAAALVRAAVRSALAQGGGPPRKIVRWRG